MKDTLIFLPVVSTQLDDPCHSHLDPCMDHLTIFRGVKANQGKDVEQIFVQTKSWMVHIIIVDPRCQNIIVEKCEEEQTAWEENRV